MIIDTLANASAIYNLNPLFKKAFEYIKSRDMQSAPIGRLDLKGNDLYLMVQEPDGKKKDEAVLEAHRKYIDIQIPLSGEESYGWKAVSGCQEVSTLYNGEKDCVLYNDKPTTYVTLQPKQFAIFFPEDGHAPCIAEGRIKKIVVKVKI